MLADLAYRREKKLCVWACFVSSGLGVSISVRVYACGCVGSLCVCVCVGGGEVSALLGFVQVKSSLISCLNALSTKAFG